MTLPPNFAARVADLLWRNTSALNSDDDRKSAFELRQVREEALGLLREIRDLATAGATPTATDSANPGHA